MASIDIQGVDPSHLKLVLDKMRNAGVTVTERSDGMVVSAAAELQPVDVVTLPFPGFPTDLQPQFLLLLSQARGSSMLTENVFDGRFSVNDRFLLVSNEPEAVAKVHPR